MPPKKDSGAKKAEQKQKQKVADDKTFGLKNKKKSAKVQKFVQEVNKQAQGSNSRKDKQAEDQKTQAKTKKQLEEQKKAEIAELFKVVQTQKVPFGTDPKTVLCAFYKSGQCTKGDKCKFSHDLNIERKGAKIDLYTDKRAQEEDLMETWDQKKLEDVITSKHGNPQTTTDIVCKFFIEAIENNKYGWFWTCPNGGDQCKYRHALPPGYVLKKKDAKREDEEEKISLEEFLETERHNLGTNLTPITYETFQAWKKRRLEKAAQEAEASRKAKESAFKQGRKQGMSGRDLFTFAPDNAGDDGDDDGHDDDAMDLSHYLRESNEADAAAEEEARNQGIQNALSESRKAGAVASSESSSSSAAAATEGSKGHQNGVELDESLFAEEDLENLDLEDDS
ncbi:Translation machinery-associated protein 46 [Sorochytrium milnesiophthora]